MYPRRAQRMGPECQNRHSGGFDTGLTEYTDLLDQGSLLNLIYPEMAIRPLINFAFKWPISSLVLTVLRCFTVFYAVLPGFTDFY